MNHVTTQGRIALFTLVCFMTVGSLNVYAERGDLKVMGMQGDVQTMPAGSMMGQPAAEDAMLSEGDTIKTGPGAVAVLELEKYGKFTVASDSELRIDKKQLQDKVIDAQFNLTSGTLKGDLKKLPEGSVIQLNTPTSVAAVRGTVFLLAVSIAGIVTMYVSSGAMTLQSIATGESMTVNEGEAASASSSGMESVDPSSAEFQAIVEAFESAGEQGDAATGGEAGAEEASAGGEPPEPDQPDIFPTETPEGAH